MSTEASALENDEEVDYLNLSDDAFEKLGEDIFDAPEAAEQDENVADVTSDDEEDDDGQEEKQALLLEEESKETGPALSVADEDEESDGDVESTEEEEGEADTTDKDAADDDDSSDDTADSDDTSDADDKSDTDTEVDYKAEHAKLIAPFKANGKMMTIEDVDAARKLMQMGANYNKKMGALKGPMKMLKMLEKNELLDEGKLSFLIDLSKNDPKAITQLLKDSKIDPLDLNLTEGEKYQATDHSVGDAEVALDSVIDEIRNSDTWSQTLDVVTKQWDATSKQIVADNPQLLKVIDGHIANGFYDQISTEVEKERMFGRLNDVSDIEAYKTTGDALEAAGKFVVPPLKGEQEQVPTAPTKPVEKPSSKKRQEKRRAASPTKPAAKNSEAAKGLNPLSMSDEEFMEAYDPNLL